MTRRWWLIAFASVAAWIVVAAVVHCARTTQVAEWSFACRHVGKDGVICRL